MTILLSIARNESDYLFVKMNSATRMSFSVKIPPQGANYLVKDLCRIAPIFRRLDMALMEAFDNAFKTKPSDSDINTIKRWVQMRELKDVDCGVIDYVRPLLEQDEVI